MKQLIPTSGEFGNGMQYARWGDGPKTLLWIPGGPGSDAPSGMWGAVAGNQYKPLLDAGYSVWQVTRRRNMPDGHSVRDMAADYADLIGEEFGGRVDAVVGFSYGGIIGQFLAADHPERMGRIVLAMAAAQGTAWGSDVDRRWAMARAEGRRSEAGRVMAEFVLPRPDQHVLRRTIGPVLGLALGSERTPSGDLVVEAEAEEAFDAREVVARIRVPVLLISAADDLFFTPEMVDETAAAIPDCTSIRYEGMGHLRASASSRLVRDIADWLT